MPDSWLEEGVTHELDRDALLPVLELPIDMVLVSHGEPVLEDGGERLNATRKRYLRRKLCRRATLRT